MSSQLVTWDSIKKTSGVVLSNSNLTALVPNYSNTAISSIKQSKGKLYCEITCDVNANGVIGVINESVDLVNSYSSAKSVFYVNNGSKYVKGTNSAYGSSYTTGDVVSILLDFTNGEISFWKNGISQGKAFNQLSELGQVLVAVTAGSATDKFTANFGANPFKYPLPNGFKPYNYIYSHKILLSSDDQTFSYKKGGYVNPIPVMSGYSKDGYTVSAGSEGGGSEAWKGFDGNKVSNWASTNLNTNPQKWLRVQLPSQTKIDKYFLVGYTSNVGFEPKNWTFEGSNDGTTWTVLDTQTNQTNWQVSEYREYNIPNTNTNSYKFYQINSTANNGNTVYLVINEFGLLVKEDGTLYELSGGSSEQNFLRYGIDNLEVSDFSSPIKKSISVMQSNTVLDTGKTYEHIIDMSKRQINKITFG